MTFDISTSLRLQADLAQEHGLALLANKFVEYSNCSDPLRGLVNSIDMNQVEGGFEVALTGDIAGMMALSMSEDKNKKAAFDEKTACSIKVVAGVGFEPTTFRL